MTITPTSFIRKVDMKQFKNAMTDQTCGMECVIWCTLHVRVAVQGRYLARVGQ